MKKLKRFPTFFDLKTYAENALDGDLMNKVKIVEEFNKRIPEIVDKIYKRCNFGAGYADYIFTTTHKAKGLEWKTVILLDDFFDDLGGVPDGIFSRKCSEIRKDEQDEKNILYVALTRAQTNLVFNFALFNLMLTSGDTFERIVNLKEKIADQHILKCTKCSDNIIFNDNCLGLESLSVKCGNLKGVMMKKSSGTFCSICSSSRRFVYLNSEQNIQNAERKMRSREFLRYFVGVQSDMYEQARTVVDEDEEKFKNSDDNGAGVIEHNPVLELQFDDLLIAALEDDF